MEPRPYRDERDWEKMRQLLIDGRAANNGAYYVHVGDISWWMFYPNREAEFAERIFLWEERDDLFGWCLLTPDERYLDVFAHPNERGTERAAQMFAWAEARLGERVKAQGGAEIQTMWIFEDDAVRTEFLQGRGFKQSEAFLPHFTHSLAGPIPAPTLPEGCTVRHVEGEHEAQKRAAASHAAFQSRLPFEKYWPRYLSFMQSRMYERERDRIVVAPDGRVAAFCVIWFDPVNKVGLFEPVGTHPDFQRRGLGKALMLDALERMKERGMETAIVSTYNDNEAAIKLYESVGFQRVNRLRIYAKDV